MGDERVHQAEIHLTLAEANVLQDAVDALDRMYTDDEWLNDVPPFYLARFMNVSRAVNNLIRNLRAAEEAKDA